MAIRLQRPERSLDQLKALAASGASGLARRAQDELRARTSQKLAQELAQSRAQRRDQDGGSK